MEEPKSIITKWMQYCMICGKPTEEIHHALWGNKHNLADQDHLLMPLCSYHHNSMNLYEVKRKPVTNMSVHHCEEMKALSQMLAQVCWQRQYLAEKLSECDELEHQSAEDWIEESANAFKNRYGEYYL